MTSFKPVTRPPESIWIRVCTADELCKRDQLGALLESLHMGPLKPCYAHRRKSGWNSGGRTASADGGRCRVEWGMRSGVPSLADQRVWGAL